MSYVGKPVRRIIDDRLVSGKQNYVDDINISSLHAAFVRSPYAHALVKSIDATDALKVPGVVAVFTGAQVNSELKDGIIPWVTYVDLREMKFKPRKVTEGEVKYVGDPIAVVVAKDSYVARDAADLVRVDYEPLPAAVTLEEALKGGVLVHEDLGTNLAYSKEFKGGNPEEAFKQAEKVISVSVENGRLSPSPMEPRGILAQYESGSLTVWASTQVPYYLRSDISRIFGIPSSRVRVIMPDVGGAFGSKVHLTPEEVAVIYASMKLNRPVKWVATRSEELMISTARQMKFQGEAAVKADGTVLGLRGNLTLDMGAWLTYTGPIQPQIIPPMIVGPYRIRAVSVLSRAVYTNTPPLTMYRGASRPEATFIIERTMDAVARELGIDEVELRLKNLVKPDEMPYRNPLGLTYDSGDYPGLLRRAVEKLEYRELKSWAQQERSKGRRVGVGLAFYLEICGFGPWEYGEVRVDERGYVTVVTGATPHGSGAETGIAQLVADELGVSMERINIVWGDTALGPAGMGTYGSRSVTVGGSAALVAARKVKEKMTKVAARLLNADVEEVEYSEGTFRLKKDPSKGVSWEQVAAAGYAGPDPGLAASVLQEADVTFPYGVHVSVVEVDETGIARVLEHRAYDDIGRVINPMLAEGQIHGAVVQAVGQALYERVPIDENGQITVTFADYLVPTFVEAPIMKCEFAEKPHYSNHVTKSKGVGEAGLIVGPAAIVRALEDALGVRLNKTPVTPDDIMRALISKK